MRRSILACIVILPLIDCLAACVNAPADPQWLRSLGDEDLRGALFVSGATHDTVWKANKEYRDGVLDEVQRRKLMDPGAVRSFLSRTKMTWPEIGQTMDDVRLQAGEPESRSANGSDQDVWSYNTRINGKVYQITDSRRVCFRFGKVIGFRTDISGSVDGYSEEKHFNEGEC